LTNHDANDFEVGYSGNPVRTAHGRVLTPALGPSGAEEGFQVPDAEEDIPLETQAGTRKHGVADVPAERA